MAMPAARTMKRAIVERFANHVTIDGDEMIAFPDLGQLCALDEGDYSELVHNHRKAAPLAGAVRGFAGLDESFLRHGDEDEVREALLALPGIGPWSASFVMIRGLGRMGTLAADADGKRAASRVYGHNVGDAEFRALTDRYGPFKGYWNHYLRAAG
jgi:DNA-3-methyladenine glycosylase II